jgi:hypothetical protein
VHILILNAPAAGDYFHDTTDVATNVTDPRRRETVFEVSANILFLAQVDDLQIVFVVAAFEIMACFPAPADPTQFATPLIS